MAAINNSAFVCGECGAARVRVPSGLVCPNGHGRLYVAHSSSSERRRAFLAWRDKLPEAVKVMDRRAWERVAFRIGSADILYQYFDFSKPCTPATRRSASWHVIAKTRCGNGWLVREFVAIKQKGGKT